MAALVLGLGASTAQAANFDKGWEAYQRGDYETTLKEFKPLAKEGHAGAQYHLGLMYGKGQGVPQDAAEGYAWLNLAALQGLEEAQKFREDVKKFMPSSELERAQPLSQEYYKKYVAPFQK